MVTTLPEAQHQIPNLKVKLSAFNYHFKARRYTHALILSFVNKKQSLNQITNFILYPTQQNRNFFNGFNLWRKVLFLFEKLMTHWHTAILNKTLRKVVSFSLWHSVFLECLTKFSEIIFSWNHRIIGYEI